MSFRRLAAWGGFAFVVLLVLQIILGGQPPGMSDPVSEVGEYIADNEGLLKVGVLVGHLAGPAFVLFAAGLVLKFWPLDQEHQTGWSVVILLGTVLVGAAAAVGDAVSAGLFIRGGEGLDAAVARGLWDVQVVAYTATGVGVATIAAAVAIPTWKHGLWPKWYVWFTEAVAVLGLVMMIGLVNTELDGITIVGFLTFLVWTALTSWLLFKES